MFHALHRALAILQGISPSRARKNSVFILRLTASESIQITYDAIDGALTRAVTLKKTLSIPLVFNITSSAGVKKLNVLAADNTRL
jgi:hypothetical protein